MAVSLETLALAKRLIAKSASQFSECIVRKGDSLDYDGTTLSLKSGDTTLSSISISGGDGGEYPMAEDAEVEDMLDSVLGTL